MAGLPLEFYALFLSLGSQKPRVTSLPVLTPLLPQQKAAVLAHVTRRNKKSVVKSAEQFMLFEHQTGFVSSLRLS
ncbi:hypothetical protein [Streptococcus pyogenes]|uniref:hypothetical protein n=1 Tax=Streptococcus pyogenes TaxID=1314 RepID=UPI0010EA7688|nr:hypothetical protein [Streptococcus pyogenes]VGR87016.1 hypothetical cytosolic protein [Streptococcus pyogenes]VGR88607.1 hypothetical cytosolic protein [Streptococcus pyogenes]VHE71583.1 putative cytoplasmic protein [Streptococcus pyogenes]VHF69048.1 putative cytoplasmic protein [Streptococcus pyogenes]VHH38816.1 putative cytoplasmic protein [Streptococcus pyogenes]